MNFARNSPGACIVSANLSRVNFAIKTNVFLLESSKTTVKQSAKVAQIRWINYNKRKMHLEITKSFGITIVSANLSRFNFVIKIQMYFCSKVQKPQ